jgi:hypothetical protein
MTDFTTALGGTFIDPFKAYNEARKNGGGVSAGSSAAARGVAMGFGSMAGVVTKGTLVNAPLALAEGVRSVPRLYGEQVPDYGKVTDWQSGGIVAAKVSLRQELYFWSQQKLLTTNGRTLATAFTTGSLG